MEFLSIAHSDVGIKKKTNQDSVLIETAETDLGTVVFAVICDGMGGLAKGEVASSALIRAFEEWFETVFPSLLYERNENGEPMMDTEKLRVSMTETVRKQNKRIGSYGTSQNVSLGTTITALLLHQDKYYIINIGDSRIYMVHDELLQLTKDHTYVQREVDSGRMTYEQSLTDSQRNVLLQCVGASDEVYPDFFAGTYPADTVFMVCSDGFRHVIEPQEFYERLRPQAIRNEDNLRETAVYLTELNKSRGEKDNISVALIYAY